MLPRKILSNLLLVAVLVGFSTGCSSLARYRFDRAQKFEKHSSAEQALARYALLLEQIPTRDKELRSQVYFRIGECLWRLERVNEALAAFESAADIDQKNLPAHLRLGEIYLAGGAAQRATEQAHTILQLAAANLDGLALLGAASSAVGDSSLAQQAFVDVQRLLHTDDCAV
jgi:tetratricopeptide (TPR) repeat protein